MKPTKNLGTRLGRGIVDKGLGTEKIFLHKHASYMIIFAGSKNEVVNGGPDDGSYYTLRMGVVLESPVERISLLRMQVGMNKQISGQ